MKDICEADSSQMPFGANLRGDKMSDKHLGLSL
jgi:hypothetical protein